MSRLERAGAALPHLSGRGAGVRQAIAAHFLRGCRHIIEIGGAGAPITFFLAHAPDSVTVFDPKIEPYESDVVAGAPCRARHIAAKFQARSFAPPQGGYGLVLLGLSLKPFGARAALDKELVALARGASLVIIEFSLALGRATEQAPALIAQAGLVAEVSVDLAISDGVIEAAGHDRRRLLVLKPEGTRSG